MRATRGTQALRLLLAIAAPCAAVAVSCYNPDIESGALACGPNNECPDGFECRARACWKKGTGPGGGTGGTASGGSGGSSGGMGGGSTGGMGGFMQMCPAPHGPFAGCTVMSRGGCDPVCQAGCACNQRCTLDSERTSCRPASGPYVGGSGNNWPNEACNPQADSCRPGAICLDEVDPAVCGSHCYKFCRGDTDCPSNSRCTFGTSNADVSVCSPPIDECNPVGRGTCPNRPGFGCYILSARYPDNSVCDCAGNRGPMESCQYEHECQPGLECVGVGGQTQCRRVCTLGVTGLCPVGQACTPFTSGGVTSMRFGYCR